MGDLIDKAVQFSQIIGQANQLIQRAHLQVWYVKFIIDRQAILFAGYVVESFPCLLAGFVSGS